MRRSIMISWASNDKPLIPNATFIMLYRVIGKEKLWEYNYTHEYRPK